MKFKCCECGRKSRFLDATSGGRSRIRGTAEFSEKYRRYGCEHCSEENDIALTTAEWAKVDASSALPTEPKHEIHAGRVQVALKKKTTNSGRVRVPAKAAKAPAKRESSKKLSPGISLKPGKAKPSKKSPPRAAERKAGKARKKQ